MSKQDVKIKVFASVKQQKTYDRNDEKLIIDLFQKEVLPKLKEDYHSVSIKVERKADSTPKALIAYMLRQDSYTADVTRVDVDDNYNVQGVQENYDDSLEVGDEAEEEADDLGYYADYDMIDFVAGTPVPEIPTAKDAVETIAQWAANAGLTPKVLLGSHASVANYKKYLRSGLQGFVNVGHGYTGGIVLDDGRLRYSWFQSLTQPLLSPEVVYFNSCQVHNPPLLPAVMSAGARTYIGGIVNLLIGPSENVCKCFWNKILFQGARMGDALRQCESKHYPTKGAHGITGDMEMFRTGHIIVFQHANFRGAHRHIFCMESNLNHCEDRSLNDKISSFVVISGTWKLYRHSNFRVQLGREYGPGEYRWVGSAGVQNDQVSSLRCIRA